jgi:hypothetical protein
MNFERPLNKCTTNAFYDYDYKSHEPLSFGVPRPLVHDTISTDRMSFPPRSVSRPLSMAMGLSKVKPNATKSEI